MLTHPEVAVARGPATRPPSQDSRTLSETTFTIACAPAMTHTWDRSTTGRVMVNPPVTTQRRES